MLEVGRKDPRLLVFVGDISHFILKPFAEACPRRYYNVGICEATIVSMAAGVARVGFHPVVHTIAPFVIERAFEQIKLDFCYQHLGGNVVTLGSSFDYSNLGCTHHCYGDFALLKTLPGAQITYPSSPVEFDALFRQTYRNGALTLFRIPASSHGLEFRSQDIQFGKGMKVTEGNNLTIVVTGPQLLHALAARDALGILGWVAEILYIHTIRPLDSDLICTSVEKTRHVLVVEEHMQSGGLGDDVLRITRDIPGVRFSSQSIPDAFVTDYGSYAEHCERLGLTEDGIVNRVKKEFGRTRPVLKRRRHEANENERTTESDSV